MINELIKIEKLLLDATQSQFSNLVEEDESREYLGYNFEAGNYKFKFRKSKITPKKIGQFVTLWKRNFKNETEPFDETEKFDFCIILTEENENYGFFLFPKSELIKQQILSTKFKDGKRGFRIYPKWTKTQNKQAEKTQIWQTEYFFDFSIENNEAKKRLLELLTNK